MQINHHINSLFSSITYGIGGVLLDPGDKWEGFNEVSAVLLTHAHFDHIYGLNQVVELNPKVRVFTNEVGKEMLLNARKNMSLYNDTPFVFEYPERIVMVNDREEIDLGNGVIAKAVFTPGHNPSCITWIIGDALFTGDVYIPGLKTVTNLPGGNKQQAQESLELIQELAQKRTVYPGH